MTLYSARERITSDFHTEKFEKKDKNAINEIIQDWDNEFITAIDCYNKSGGSRYKSYKYLEKVKNMFD